MARELHPEWREAREATRYPFADRATLVNNNGDFLPETVFLDAVFHVVGARERLYLARVDITHQTATLVLGDIGSRAIASGSFDLISPPDLIAFTDNYGRSAGLLVSEALRLSVFQSWSLGEHVFARGETEFAATCCVPVPDAGVRGLLTEENELLTGDVWLVGGDGVVLSWEQTFLSSAPGAEPVEVVRVDVVGDPLFRRRLCQGAFTTPRFLKTITIRVGDEEFVCGPDELGDFKITVAGESTEDTVLRIRMKNDAVIFEAVGERLEGIG